MHLDKHLSSVYGYLTKDEQQKITKEARQNYWEKNRTIYENTENATSTNQQEEIHQKAYFKIQEKDNIDFVATFNPSSLNSSNNNVLVLNYIALTAAPIIDKHTMWSITKAYFTIFLQRCRVTRKHFSE